MRTLSFLLIAIVLMTSAPSVQARTSVAAFCAAAERLARNPKSADHPLALSLFAEAGKLCGFTFSHAERTGHAWQPRPELRRYPVPYNTAFPHARPTYTAPRSVPHCRRNDPIHIVCGNAVPVSCIWQC